MAANNAKRFIRPAIALAGVLVLSLWGWKSVELGMERPDAPTIATTADATATPTEDPGGKALSDWNNRFAKTGFFALVGLFLLLIGVLPKKRIWVAKLVFSTGLVALIIHHILGDQKIISVVKEGLSISVLWVFLAFVVKGTGMGCTVWRWKVLLEGQGFKIPLRHLIESFLIGRFIGSFAPGTSGLDGYRAYDIARYTGKIARSISVIVVEKLIGFFVLGTLLLAAIPIGSRLFAEHDVNATALAMMGLIFSGMMVVALAVLFKPGVFRWIANRFIPAASPARGPIDKAIRAVTAYERRKLHLVKATAIGFGVHLCTIGMYFCTSRAIGQHPLSADLFVTAAMMIGATIMPLSIAGIGMREGVFAFFLGPVAAIYAFGGYLVGEVISLFGGPIWLARRASYYEVIKTQREAINRGVEEDEVEETQTTREKAAPAGPSPSFKEYALTGLGAGLVAGLGVAILDSVRLWFLAKGGADLSLPGYAALLYGPFLGALGALFGTSLALLAKLVSAPRRETPRTATFISFSLFFVFAFAIAFFFLQRDLFEEKVGLFSPKMLGSLAALGACLLALCVGKALFIRRLLRNGRERFAGLRYTALIYAVSTAALVVLWIAAGGESKAAKLGPAPSTTEKRPNIVLVMCDTLRADHVGAHGSTMGLTPNLDALAQDGVTFRNAFAQASWTKPSVATMLTGRYPSSHTATLKGSILPEEVTTLAEVLTEQGYESTGIVTNYNLTPFFNFDQGFADYRYLAPNLPLWATDTQSKLVLVELLKKVNARLRGKRESPSDYYVIGEELTKEALARLDKLQGDRPFFMFLAYMDPHDPYFSHPFDGRGISRRSNENPPASMADEMRELYKGEVKYWDETFGEFVAGLKSRGIYDDTLIAVVSDHGEEFNEHSGFWHGTTLYDEQLRVVFVVKYPRSSGVTGGSKQQSWVRLLDLAPMLISTAGLEVPAEMQGSAAPKSAYEPVFSEEDHQGNVLTSLRRFEDGKEVKLIRANKGNPRGLEPLELYRTDLDSGEKDNLANREKPLLERSVESLDRAEAAASQGAASALTGELSPEAARQLKNLGYMQDK